MIAVEEGPVAGQALKHFAQNGSTRRCENIDDETRAARNPSDTLVKNWNL